MVSNKKAVMVASCLAAIPLATLLVAITINRRRSKSLRAHKFSGQTKSTTGVTTTAATERQQPKEKSPGQQPLSLQGSETKALTSTATDGTITTKSTTTTTTTSSAAISSPIVPSSTSDSPVIVSDQTPKEEEMSVSDEARKAEESLKELIVTAVKEAKDSANETGKRLKEQTINIAATADSKDIRSLGDNLDALVDLFEETMIEIRKQRYDDQIKLLDNYKGLLHTHIKVVNARSRMASKLKPGA
jgi:type III secretory pathway component EscV